jgi:hypothetical protein
VFAAASGLGLILGWALARALLNERLSHQQLRIADLQGVLDGKLPATFLPPPKRTKLMSFPLILSGLGLAAIGLALVALGMFWPTKPELMRPSQTAAPAAASNQKPLTIPKFTTQFDKEKFRKAIDDLSAIVDQQGNAIVALSENVAGVSPITGGSGDASIPLEKLQRLRIMYNAVSDLLDGGGRLPFFDQYPAYKTELLSIMPDNTQNILVGFSITLHQLTRAVLLIQSSKRHPDDRELNEQAMTNIGTFQQEFREATGKLHNGFCSVTDAWRR